MTWTADGFVFKVDDNEFYRVTKAMVEQHGRWAYDTPKFLIVNFALGGQYPQSVNRVTTPYAGLPEATADLIKANRVQLLVNWVRHQVARTWRQEGLMNNKSAMAFLTMGFVFLAIGILGPRANYIGLGAAFLAIGLIFLVRQKRGRDVK